MAQDIEYIDHEGMVTAVNLEKSTVTVTIREDEECGDCPAGKLCHNFAADKNKLEISVSDPKAYRIGETVTVRGSEKLQMRAVMLINLIPTLAIIVVLVGIYLLTGSQLTAGLCAIGALIFFFIGIYLIRNRLAKEFVFKIIKEEKQ